MLIHIVHVDHTHTCTFLQLYLSTAHWHQSHWHLLRVISSLEKDVCPQIIKHTSLIIFETVCLLRNASIRSSQLSTELQFSAVSNTEPCSKDMTNNVTVCECRQVGLTTALWFSTTTNMGPHTYIKTIFSLHYT